MSQRYVHPFQTALDTNGVTISFAKLNFYITGTTTRLATYSDEALSVANANPVVADASGRFSDIFLKAQDYKVVFTDASDVQIWAGDAVFTSVGRDIENIFSETQVWKKGTDVASATDLLVNIAGNEFDVTGTTTIATLATKGIGTLILLHFDGALTFTHHATNLVLPSAANITTAAGDMAIMQEYASADWRCVSYMKASGEAVVTAALSGVVGETNIKVHLIDGTYTKPADLVSLIAFVWGPGGGGGGGNGNDSVGAGGGGGGFSMVNVLAASVGSTEVVTVGVGGGGGGDAANGSTGLDPSSFGAHGIALAGTGGSDGTTNATGGAGGATGTGDLKLAGGDGGDAINSANDVCGGHGGQAPFMGVFGAIAGRDMAGNVPAANTGGGGSGGNEEAAGQVGGNGADGLVIVWEFKE